MFKQIVFNKNAWIAGVISVAVLFSSMSQAAPGTLSNTPLFIANKVQPNIFFAIDDSGSMEWETTLNAGTWNPGDVADTRVFDANTGDHIFADPEGFRSVCLGYNVLAYNPAFIYTPWRGEDDDGDVYTNKTLTTALHNPYDDDSIRNISSHYYFPWTDADNDGEYDGPGSTAYLAAVGPGEECGDLTSTAGGVAINSLPATLNPGDAGYPNSQQNYANWFTYYRQRDYVMKRAISELISDSNTRMGLATLWDRNGVGTPVGDMTNSSDKDDLLDELFQVEPANGTPLRSLLDNVGKYFDQAGNNNEHSDLGFTNSSPILNSANGGECQQNFAVVFSDGYWNSDGGWSIANHDGDDDTSWDGDSHADTFSNTLADVAMYYYETDLSTGLSDNVPTLTGIDENPAQHLVTYTVAFGIDGTLTANPADRTTPFAWPQPVANQNTTVDDMRHAAWNGRGEFLSARDPGTLITALSDAINSIADRSGSAAAVTFNTSSLQSGSRVYLSEFNTSGWKGDLLAFDLNSTTGTLSPSPVWSAQTQLDARNLSSSPRIVYSYNDDEGVTFTWANITNAMKDDLRTNPDSSVSTDAIAQTRLDFIVGDRSNEGTGNNFRTRTSRLGDIIHSAPKFVGAPELNYPDADPFGTTGARYSTFKYSTTYENREKVVYSSSNGGMLHAFSNTSGAEVLAYVPSFLGSTVNNAGLHYLTDPNYVHTYYADHTAAIDDVYIKTSPTGSASWRTVLVSGVRGGERGLFALDVTNPSTFTTANAAKNVLWEFDSSDDADLGYTFSEPSVVMLNNDRWGVVFGNGYNNTGSGEAVVYVLLLEGSLDGDGTGENGAWTLGTNFYKLSTGSGVPGNRNGMSTLTPVDIDNDGRIDRLYGGDIQGDLWAFDISDTNPANWGSAYDDGATPTPSPRPLFTSPNNQQITVKPDVIRLPDVATTPQNYPNIMLYFGTGQFIATNDNATTDQQALYGIWDAGSSDLTTTNLIQQTLATDATQTNARYINSNNTVSYSNNPVKGTDRFGWYMNLLATGERVIVDPVVRGNLVFFATMIPDSATCNVGGGSGFLMATTLADGQNPVGGSFDVNNDGVIDANDQLSTVYAAGIQFTGAGIPAGLSFLGNDRLYVPDTGGGGGASNVQITNVIEQNPDANGRLSWQEMIVE